MRRLLRAFRAIPYLTSLVVIYVLAAGQANADGLGLPVPLTITLGGTGATSLANHGVIKSTGTALTAIAPGSNGNVLQSNGTDWTSATVATGNGILSTTNGGNALGASATKFAPLAGLTFAVADDATARNVMPQAGTVANCTISTSTAQPNTGTLVGTVRKNGVNSTIVVTVTSNAAAGNFADNTHTLSYSATDQLGWTFTNNAGTTSATMASWSCQV